MTKELKIATLVISSTTYPAVRNMKMQKKIYLNNNKNSKNINNIFWYRQGTYEQLKGAKYNLIDNDLFIDISDDTLNMGRKTLLAFEWLNENIDYDFLVRPTPSSYVNFNNLDTYIKEHFVEKEIVYGGKIQETKDKEGNTIQFASGSTLILNKQCVDLVLKNQNLWDHDYWDDVGLALTLKKLGVDPCGGDRFDVTGNPYKQKIDLSYYQYRCRSDNHYGYPRLIESHVLKSIDELFSRKNKHQVFPFFKSSILELLRFFYIYQFGWKVYSFFRLISKFLMPNSLYFKIKRVSYKKIESFKHKRFKT